MLPDTVDGNRSVPTFCSMEEAPKYISKHRQSVDRPSVFCSCYYNGFITCPSLLEIVIIRVPVRNIETSELGTSLSHNKCPSVCCILSANEICNCMDALHDNFLNINLFYNLINQQLTYFAIFITITKLWYSTNTGTVLCALCAGMSYVCVFFCSTCVCRYLILFVYADSVALSTRTSYIPGASQQAITSLVILAITENSTTE
jgi:hypothetical protein